MKPKKTEKKKKQFLRDPPQLYAGQGPFHRGHPEAVCTAAVSAGDTWGQLAPLCASRERHLYDTTVTQSKRAPNAFHNVLYWSGSVDLKLSYRQHSAVQIGPFQLFTSLLASLAGFPQDLDFQVQVESQLETQSLAIKLTHPALQCTTAADL